MKLDFSKMIVTRIVSVARLNSSPLMEFTERSSREYWAMVLKKEGKSLYHCNGESFYADATHPILLPKGSSYSWACVEAGECLMTEFECEEESDTLYTFRIQDISPMLRNFARIEKRQLAKSANYQIRNIHDFYESLFLLAETEQIGYVPSSKRNKIQPAMDYILEHYDDPAITNDSLADLCGISNVYFRKTFTSVYHVAPMQYLRTIRMEQAAALLRNDYHSISQVAQSVGYSSLYHFSKMFRHYYGVSPSRFENMNID